MSREDYPFEHTTGGYTVSPGPLEQPWIELKGGVKLTATEAKAALDEAMTIIECVGTTGIHDKWQRSNAWMKKFYPAWA